MDHVLAGLHWETCLFYLDDIIVFACHPGRAPRPPPTSLRAAPPRTAQTRRRKMHIRGEGSQLPRSPGHLRRPLTRPYSTGGHQGDRPPKTATEVRSFLGLAGYYRRYVKNFAAIDGPLHPLTRKDAVFHWSPECQDAFDCLKTPLTTSPITAFPDFSLPFRLYTNASTAGLGAILAQVWEGKEHIICCASRSLNQVEKTYPTTKLECLAIVWAVAKFRPYLMSMSFEVYTDH